MVISRPADAIRPRSADCSHCRRRRPQPSPPARPLARLLTQGVGVQEVLRALVDAVRAGDKAGRAQLMSLLLRLFFFEELPPGAVTTLLPLFQAGASHFFAAICVCEQRPSVARELRTLTWLLCTAAAAFVAHPAPAAAAADLSCTQHAAGLLSVLGAGAGQGRAHAALAVLSGRGVLQPGRRGHAHALRPSAGCAELAWGCCVCTVCGWACKQHRCLLVLQAVFVGCCRLHLHAAHCRQGPCACMQAVCLPIRSCCLQSARGQMRRRCRQCLQRCGACCRRRGWTRQQHEPPSIWQQQRHGPTPPCASSSQHRCGTSVRTRLS